MSLSGGTVPGKKTGGGPQVSCGPGVVSVVATTPHRSSPAQRASSRASRAAGAGGGERLATLTSLRAVAALAVFTRHASEAFFPDGHGSPLTRQGATGVSFFFILSGFVLAWSARPGDGAGGFYRRRFARIYPAYILVLVLTQVSAGTRHGLSPLTLLANATLVQSWVPRSSVYFASDMGAWSLGCEMFFYLLFPLVLPRLVTLTPRRRWQVAAAAGAVELAMAVATRSPQQAGGLGLWLVYVLPLTRLGEFVIGMVLALAVRGGLRPRVSLNQALALAVAAYLLAGFVPVWLMWVAVTLVPFCLLVVAAAAWDVEGRPTRLRHPHLVRAGHWSYAFYLVHISVVTVVKHVAGTPRGTAAQVALTLVSLALAVGAAGCLFTFVERPAERRLRGDRTLPVDAGGTGHLPAPAPVSVTSHPGGEGGAPGEPPPTRPETQQPATAAVSEQGSNGTPRRNPTPRGTRSGRAVPRPSVGGA